MELKIGTDTDKWNVHCVIMLKEDDDDSEMSKYTMIGEIDIPKAQCGTPESMQNTVHGAVSHMVHKMVNKWRLSLVHTIREAVIAAIQPPTSPGEAPRSGGSDASAIDIADGVLPTPPREAVPCEIFGHQYGRGQGGRKCIYCEAVLGRD